MYLCLGIIKVASSPVQDMLAVYVKQSLQWVTVYLSTLAQMTGCARQLQLLGY